MHDCDVMINVGARFDDRVTGRLAAFSPNSKKIHVDIDPSSINKNVRVDVPIVGDVAHVLEDMIEVWKARQVQPEREGARRLVEADRGLARRAIACTTRTPIRSSSRNTRCSGSSRAIKDKDFYITTEVGQHQMWAAQFLKFEKPNRWMTSGGLGTMGYGLPAAIGVQIAHPEVAGHRRRRRGLDPDEHPGDVDGRAVPAAGEGLHPQQPVDGHGAAVAGAAAWRALFRELHRGAARFRQAGRGLRRRRPARREADRGRRRHRGDDRRQAPVHRRCRASTRRRTASR